MPQQQNAKTDGGCTGEYPRQIRYLYGKLRWDWEGQVLSQVSRLRNDWMNGHDGMATAKVLTDCKCITGSMLTNWTIRQRFQNLSWDSLAKWDPVQAILLPSDLTTSCDAKSASRNLLFCKTGTRCFNVDSTFNISGMPLRTLWYWVVQSLEPLFDYVIPELKTQYFYCQSLQHCPMRLNTMCYHTNKNISSGLSGQRNCQQLQQISCILFIFKKHSIQSSPNRPKTSTQACLLQRAAMQQLIKTLKVKVMLVPLPSGLFKTRDSLTNSLTMSCLWLVPHLASE